MRPELAKGPRASGLQLFGSSKVEAACAIGGPLNDFHSPGPSWHRCISYPWEMVLCDPGQVSALLWASVSSYVNKEFENLLRGSLSDHVVNPAEDAVS